MQQSRHTVTLMRYALVVLSFFLLSFSASGQMRRIYNDFTYTNNALTKLSFYTPSEGYVAFKYWYGYTTDSGRTFVKKYITISNVNTNGYPVNMSVNFIIQGMKAFNQNTIIVYGNYGYSPAILYSANGGISFTVVYYSNYYGQYNIGLVDMLFPQNTGTGYAIDGNRILKTTNYGQNWALIRTETAYYDRFEALDDNTIFILCTSYATTRLMKTSDGGTNWQAITLPGFPTDKMTSACFLTPATGWLSMLSSDNVKEYMYKTTNGGSSWTLQNEPGVTGFASYRMRFMNDSTGYAVYGFFNLYKTSNGGAVWEPLERNNSFAYNNETHSDLQFITSDQLWAGGAQGFIELNTNAGGPPLPKAYFKMDTANAFATNIVKLINYSRPFYQHRWYVNGVLASTSYQATYTHDVYHPYDTVKLVVSNGVKTDSTIQYQYVKPVPKPVITSFAPTSGTVGTVITINGNYLLTTSAVRIGNRAASSFTVVSGSSVTAVVDSAQSGYVSVTTTGGKDSVAGFTFVPPPPTITSVTPQAVTPGTTITISGFYLGGATAVSIGGTPAGSFTSVSPTRISADVAGGSNGPVAVTTPTGTVSFGTISFMPIVKINSFAPAAGPVGTSVTLNGSGFNPVATGNVVFFGGAKATVTSASATQLVVKVPAGAGYQPIRVEANQLTASTAKPFVPTFPNGGTITTQSFANAGVYSGKPGGQGFGVGAIGDLDLDGKLDVVAATAYPSPAISIFRNTSVPGNITLGSRMDVFQNYYVDKFLLRDMNADGLLDIIAVAGNIAVFTNQSTPGNIAFSSPILLYLPNTSSNRSCDVADIDGDGRPDISASIDYTSSVTVYRNTSTNGAMSFGPAVPYDCGTAAWGIALADLDGDEKPDMIAQVSSTTQDIKVFRNLSTVGRISFGTPVGFTLSYGGRDIITGDIDGDGKADLIACKSNLKVYRNTSTGVGNFSFDPVAFNGPENSFTADIADMNGDGKPDIVGINMGVATNNTNTTVTIFQNTSVVGNITFNPGVNFPTEPNAAARNSPLGDLDNDGKVDFLYMHYTINTFQIFRNRSGEPLAYAGEDTIICPGSNVVVGRPAVTGYTYSWSSSPAGFSSTTAAPSVSPTVPTTYYLQVSNAGNIIGRDTISVSIGTYPVADAGNDTNVCAGRPVTIGTAPLAGLGYAWTSAPVGFASTLPNPVVTPAATTTYYLAVTNSTGCTAKDSILVSAISTVTPFVSIAVNSTNICSGTPVAFTATPVNGGSSPAYQWQVDSVNTGTNSANFSVLSAPYSSKVTVTISSTAQCAEPVTAVSNTYTILYKNTWTGAMNTAWENTGNWSCGRLPDADTDVTINSGTVVLSSNGICRTIVVRPGATFRIITGNTLIITH